jgi:hypothetical protein
VEEDLAAESKHCLLIEAEPRGRRSFRVSLMPQKYFGMDLASSLRGRAISVNHLDEGRKILVNNRIALARSPASMFKRRDWHAPIYDIPFFIGWEAFGLLMKYSLTAAEQKSCRGTSPFF